MKYLVMVKTKIFTWILNPYFNLIAIDFIKNLIIKDPTQRLTAEQALKHPWIAVRD